jgi:PAS domain S-box-containing protein
MLPPVHVQPDSEQFRVFIETVRDYALLILDPQGQITTWNAGAQAIKGWTAPEIIGSHFSRFYPPESIASGLPERELEGAARDGRYEDEGWRVRKDGTRFWANVIITALRDASGRLTGFAKVTRDLTERRRHEESLRISEARFRALVEGVRDYAIFMLDTEGCVATWNAGAKHILGYETSEILGANLSKFYPDDTNRHRLAAHELTTAAFEGRFEDEGWRVRKDGSKFWANAVLTTIRDSTGKLTGFSKITRDLTQRRHAESLADTAQRMHEFIAMLAHELRNPLAPIRNALAIMRKRDITDPVVDSSREIIERQSGQLVRIIDELLDVNRIARGHFMIERARIDLREVVHRSVETSKPLIDARRHQFTLELDEREIPVDADALRLTQVVINLLNNAAKYTPEGGEIRLFAGRIDDHVEIRVCDNGLGIARESLDSVFDLFFQIEANTPGALGGLGVGLALVRRIVDLHGGSVVARSEGLGRGSEFIVQLPPAREA